MGQKITTAQGFQEAVAKHTQNASQQVVNGTKDGRPATKFDGRTGEYARNLHLKAGGCVNTTGAARLVL